MSHKNTGTRRDAKGFSFKRIMIVSVLVFAAVLFMISPVFDVQHINIAGNEIVAKEGIIRAAGLEGKTNIFSVLSYKAVQAVEDMPYIKTAVLEKHFPNAIDITVTERKPRGYVEFKSMHTYLLIDGEGMVLSTQTDITEALPVIVGLTFSDFAIGRRLEAENKDAFDMVVTLSQLFLKHELTDVIRLDVSDGADIHIYIRNIDVFFGGMADADLKVQTLKAIAADIKPEDRGFLHMEDVTKNPYFKFLK